MKLLISSTDLTERGHPSTGDLSLVRAATSKGLESKVVDPTGVTYCFENNGELRVFYDSEDVSKTDLVLFRRTRGAELESYQFAKAMEETGARVIDPAESLIYPTSKLVTQISRGTKYLPKTFFVNSTQEKEIQRIVEELSFPMAVKPQQGTMGKGFAKISSYSELQSYLQKYRSAFLIVQEYLDIVTLKRILLLGKKWAGSSFLMGTTDYDNSRKFEKIGEEVAQSSPTEILGVDVAKTSNERYFVLEANRNPNFTRMTEGTEFYASKIVDYLISQKKSKGFWRIE
jgi:glutathione synthase/RimK-type ligase-like ATP-grasp enzyme